MSTVNVNWSIVAKMKAMGLSNVADMLAFLDENQNTTDLTMNQKMADVLAASAGSTTSASTSTGNTGAAGGGNPLQNIVGGTEALGMGKSLIPSFGGKAAQAAQVAQQVVERANMQASQELNAAANYGTPAMRQTLAQDQFNLAKYGATKIPPGSTMSVGHQISLHSQQAINEGPSQVSASDSAAANAADTTATDTTVPDSPASAPNWKYTGTDDGGIAHYTDPATGNVTDSTQLTFGDEGSLPASAEAAEFPDPAGSWISAPSGTGEFPDPAGSWLSAPSGTAELSNSAETWISAPSETAEFPNPGGSWISAPSGTAEFPDPAGSYFSAGETPAGLPPTTSGGSGFMSGVSKFMNGSIMAAVEAVVADYFAFKKIEKAEETGKGAIVASGTAVVALAATMHALAKFFPHLFHMIPLHPLDPHFWLNVAVSGAIVGAIAYAAIRAGDQAALGDMTPTAAAVANAVAQAPAWYAMLPSASVGFLTAGLALGTNAVNMVPGSLAQFSAPVVQLNAALAASGAPNANILVQKATAPNGPDEVFVLGSVGPNGTRHVSQFQVDHFGYLIANNVPSDPKIFKSFVTPRSGGQSPLINQGAFDALLNVPACMKIVNDTSLTVSERESALATCERGDKNVQFIPIGG